MEKITTANILAKKNNEKIVMITAYDALFARLFNDYADMILVGDSLNMSFNGQIDTLNIGVDEMIYHTKAVKVGATRPLIVTDMPFGSTFDTKTTLKNAIKIYKESGADAVKIEGGKKVAKTIKRLSEEGISVVGHIGLRPQQVRFEGGYKVKGKNDDDLKIMLEDAHALVDAGVFSLVIEATMSDVASAITKDINIPTIGIGCGASTDGQVLVWSDMLGFYDEFKPKFVKRYLNGAQLVRDAVQNYANEVKSGSFPSEEFEYKKPTNQGKIYG